jgi:hypothetical protein
LWAPTANSIGINAVLESGSPEHLLIRVRNTGNTSWNPPLAATVKGNDVAEWTIDGLAPASSYEYEVRTHYSGEQSVLHRGSFTTRRPAGEAFTFSLLANLLYSNQGDTAALMAVAEDIARYTPDFMVNLGDILDFHMFGFNDPPPDGTYTRQAYLNYRFLISPTLGSVPHFGLIGNWEGENGDYDPEEIAWSMEQRLLYLPNSEPATYPEGGSEFEDYYAFTWGDALIVVLNVMTYTPTAHQLYSNPGVPDDWTLGEVQFAWLEQTLANTTSKWRFLLIHHTVGGAGPSEAHAAYGRGGGQAAYIGEQALVHQLMLDHGVHIFFYGHDHVFFDMVVDGIHYSIPGSAGAPWMFSAEETGYAEDMTWAEHGHARVDVSPDGVEVRFLGLGNTLLHSYRIE